MKYLAICLLAFFVSFASLAHCAERHPLKKLGAKLRCVGRQCR